MKILFCSYLFAPSIGGIETVSRILAREFAALGHEVRLVTESPGLDSGEPPIFRKPGLAVLLQLTRWADVVFHNNITFRFAWPLLFFRKPWIIAHHTWIQRPDGTKGIVDRLKLRLLSSATNISISTAIAKSIPVRSPIIPDPYEADVFYVRRPIPRTRDLIFVGRLVSDKGADVLLDAVHRLSKSGLSPTLSVVGDGPERQRLEQQTKEYGLVQQITFHGSIAGADLATLINEHRILVIPSLWQEPFGVVALEGIACGCVVVGSSGGGLPDAIGPCGRTFPNGDSAALAQILEELLRDESLCQHYRLKAETHLKQHQPARVAQKYIELFEQSLHSA